MAAHKFVRLQSRVMERGTVELYLQCDHCWLPSPQIGNWRLIFECFCRLSPNYTYLICRNCVCKHSVIAETTVKQRAFAIILFEFQNWVIPLCLRRRYFWRSNYVPGIPPDCDRAEKLALLHLRLFPRPFSNHATETTYVASKVCQLEWLRTD